MMINDSYLSAIYIDEVIRNREKLIRLKHGIHDYRTITNWRGYKDCNISFLRDIQAYAYLIGNKLSNKIEIFMGHRHNIALTRNVAEASGKIRQINENSGMYAWIIHISRYFYNGAIVSIDRTQNWLTL